MKTKDELPETALRLRSLEFRLVAPLRAVIENLFLVRRGKLITPSVEPVLEGVTRHVV